MSLNSWYSDLPREKRNIYAVLLGVILMTIPCYCVGFIALASAPRASVPTPTLIAVPTASRTPFPTVQFTSEPAGAGQATDTPTGPTPTPSQTLEPTPTQAFPTGQPTDTPVPPTETPSPTNTTPPQTPTNTPTGTLTPTGTPTPSPTIDATATAVATNATATAVTNATATAATNATATANANANTNATATAAANATATTDAANATATAAANANATATAQAANNPPVANNDSATTPQDTPVTINVAANDSDPDGNLDPATVTVVGGLANGSTAPAGPGQITYTPNPGFSGSDTFTYQICDTNAACATATVNLTITPTNRPPVANNDSAATTRNTPVTIDVAANDSDPDGNLDPTTITVVNGPMNGSTAPASPGQVTYTPDPGFVGNDKFTYQICDTDAACATAIVNLTVTP